MMNRKEGMMKNEKFHPLYSHKYNMRDSEDQVKKIFSLLTQMKN